MKKYNVTVNGMTYEVEIEETGSVASAPITAAPAAAPAPAPAAAPVAAPAPEAPAVPAAPAGAKGKTEVLAPMNGTILGVNVNVGDSIKKGDTVVILESMKMENDIPAPADGVVASVEVRKGDIVDADAVLITLN